MNRLTIIGNLTKDPEARTTQDGKSVCTFTVAVNRMRTQNNQGETDFFRCTAWNQLAENCGRYLSKGRKVAVVGSVRVETYEGRDGKTYASMNVLANEVEFLSPARENTAADAAQVDAQTGMEKVPADDLPF